ncbi:Calcium-dependent phosphotriesterase superfamily protein [Heracleum sosnowskyi]|uniref:Calcium-dependent phosphotriesterase superfamily protein n=1 Tax=Heracleum sosnowskyi TaxID=360622 RepID=A0AAD8M279_9APIA|nr:Calcium-dependent phosphotriesterase superfamily protein [Heracleum sosnowskyi]
MGFFCSAKFLSLILLISAIPIAILISLESAKPTSHQYHFHSSGYLRECSKYDSLNSRFIVSFMEGGLGIIPISNNKTSNTILAEIPVVKDADLFTNATLGFSIDSKRNRVVVAISDLLGHKYSAVAAYDLSNWNRLFLTQLSGPGDKSMADDVAVDAEGNAYITDVNKAKIWKVGVTGEYLSKIESPLFSPPVWYHNLVTLNGIVYHPNGYLLVSHTSTSNLFKVDIKNNNEVKLVKMIGKSLSFTDGLELLSSNRLVVTGNPRISMVGSNDDWETATILEKAPVVKHRLATAVTVKDGKVYISHLFGMGYPKKKHVLAEAVFSGL